MKHTVEELSFSKKSLNGRVFVENKILFEVKIDWIPLGIHK